MALSWSAEKEAKRKIRVQAIANRQAQPNKDALSRVICERFAALPEYAAARTILFYIDFGAEVRTRPLVRSALDERKEVVVPYCSDDTLELFRLRGFEELDPGTWGILEPKVELRPLADRRVRIDELDLVMVPGVAFDRRGGRLGHGKGYYDKLLSGAGPATQLVAVAFDCQMFAEIPMLPHDIYMDKVLTETGETPNPQAQ